RSLRQSSGSCLVARSAEGRASFNEAPANAVMRKKSVRAGRADSLEMTRGQRLRELIANDCVAMPGAPNASIARQIERAGFDAVYISGAGLANCTAGLPDIGLLTLSEVVLLAGFIAKAVKIPAIVDADTGFGGVENAARAIYELEAAGLAGCHLEDQEFP